MSLILLINNKEEEWVFESQPMWTIVERQREFGCRKGQPIWKDYQKIKWQRQLIYVKHY